METVGIIYITDVSLTNIFLLTAKIELLRSNFRRSSDEAFSRSVSIFRSNPSLNKA